MLRLAVARTEAATDAHVVSYHTNKKRPHGKSRRVPTIADGGARKGRGTCLSHAMTWYVFLDIVPYLVMGSVPNGSRRLNEDRAADRALYVREVRTDT